MTALELFNQQEEKLTWDYISSDEKLYWTEEFINAHIDKINWTNFTQNIQSNIYSILHAKRKPKPVREIDYFNFFKKYEAYLDWNILSSNELGLYISKETLSFFAHKWNWALLIQNNTLEWKYEDLQQYDSYLSKIPIEKLQKSECWKTIISDKANEIYKQEKIKRDTKTIEEILEEL